MPPHQTGRWAEKLSRSGYFLVAVMLHLVVFVMVGTYIIWPKILPPEPPGVVDLGRPPQVVPPPSNPAPTVDVVSPASSSAVQTPFTPIMGGNANAPAIDFQPKGIDDNPLARNPPHGPAGATAHKLTDGMSQERKDKIRHTVGDIWKVPRDADPQAPAAKFSIYIAKYANGDWDCNTVTKDGDITAGSIPNLLEKIREWSHGATKGDVMAKPLDIGSPDLLAVMPPFIFFTGHKDFKLTDQEIANLKDYLQCGGCIWGDNALAGVGSRFDVAFRREMRRVIPDKDKDFEPLDLKHDIFTKGKFRMEEVPEGMNYFAENIEHIDLDGVLAILYTPNDYSDMMFFRILPGDKMADPNPYPSASHPLYTNGTFRNSSRVYYRNFDLESSLVVEKFGMDVVAHLLTRFQEVMEGL